MIKRVLHSESELPDKESYICAIGFFDGLHIGHQVIIRKAVEMARADGRLAGVITFSPHPRKILFPERKWEYLETEEERVERILSMDVDFVLIIKSDPEFLKEEPETFLENLASHKGLKGLVCGENFTFGKNARGNSEFLKTRMKEKGIEVAVEPLRRSWLIGNRPVSSTEIRRLVKEGEVERARSLLGHPYVTPGYVVHGFERGHELLGYPTANLSVDEGRVIPKDGVYAVRAVIDGVRYPAVTNVGYNPTFGNERRSIETFILSFGDDIYGKPFAIEWITRLRGEIRFPSVEALQKQIALDIEKTEKILIK